MILGIDHLVIACRDPDDAARLVESEVGLAVGGGGRHAGRGSWNRIVWLADGSYLELIGIDDPDLASRSPINAAAMRALEAGGGLATYALLTDNLEATVQSLRAAGASFRSPVHGSRTRDDGEVVEWWTSIPDRPLAPDGVPFLIQHAHHGAEWGPQALEDRARFVHPIGSPVRLHGLDIRADDPVSRAADLHAELQVDFWSAGGLAVADVGPHVIRLVPTNHEPRPATVSLAAEVDEPTTVDILGLRFVTRPAVQRIPPTAPG